MLANPAECPLSNPDLHMQGRDIRSPHFQSHRHGSGVHAAHGTKSDDDLSRPTAGSMPGSCEQ